MVGVDVVAQFVLHEGVCCEGEGDGAVGVGGGVPGVGDCVPECLVEVNISWFAGSEGLRSLWGG